MTTIDTLQPPSRDVVARRAYEIYLRNGRMDGHDRDDWLQAEYELMHLPVRKLAALAPQQTALARGSSALLKVICAAAAM